MPRLQRELEAKESLQQYHCCAPYCGRQYTSLDINSILDMASGALACEVCGSEVRPVNAVTGQAINTEQQRERKKVRRGVVGWWGWGLVVGTGGGDWWWWGIRTGTGMGLGLVVMAIALVRLGLCASGAA